MKRAYELSIETRGAVCDLGRVVGVFALLDLTPSRLVSEAVGCGLRIDVQIVGEARSYELCVSRLRALACVTSATLVGGEGRRPKSYAPA